MEKFCRAILTLTFLISLQSLALAAPDTYIGDAAIYSAIDIGSTRPKPHVLLLIDTSQSTLNRASGLPYIFDPDAPVPYPGTNAPWSVYVSDNQGNFSRVEVASADSTLAGITCSTAGGITLKNSLLNSGTYSGSGSAAFPNLQGGACDTGPSGATYALGNYLNYLTGSATAGSENIVKDTYDCSIGRKSGNKWIYATVTDGCVGTFKFTGTSIHTTSASTEPQKGVDWQTVWTQTSSGCVPGVTNCSSTSLPPALTVATTIPPWSLTAVFTPTATFVGGTQRKIIYDALTQVAEGARGAVKFAAMTYNPNNQGGSVVYDMNDLSIAANFAAFMAALPGEAADGTLTGAPLINSVTNRPQSEALYDAGYYLGAHYPTSGTISSTAVFPLNATSFAANNISTTMAGKYQASNKNQCGYNHIILITNGLSNGDGSSGAGPLAKIVDADGDQRSNEAVYGGGSHYLDDVAAYLKKQEGITTHTVLAFQSSDPLIEGAAYNGGGKFYNVYDAETLRKALLNLLATIVNESDTSFVAPVVPASSTNRTISSNRVYLGLFKPQNNRPWLGNLKKYGVSSDLTLLDKNNVATTDLAGDFLPNSKSYWGANSSDRIMSIDGLLPLTGSSISGDGGNVAAGGVGGTLLVNLRAALPGSEAYVTRKIYTWPSGSTTTTLTDAANRFSPANANITAALLGVASDTEKDKLIKYVAGADGYDENNNGNSTEIRNWVLGDILHSKPLIFSYSSYTAAQEGNCTYNKSLIFVGSNDGMVHAFKDCDGSEAWAFIPDNLLSNLKYLREAEHYYFSDAPPTAYVHDVDNDNIIETADGDKVVLIFGQGRGGGRNTLDASGARGAYYAIDVSNPEAPVLLMKIDSTVINRTTSSDFAELGETWSPPRLAKVKVGTADKVVAFVGAGYDNNEDLRYGNNMLFPDGTTTATDTTVITGDGGNNSSTGTSAPLNAKGRGVYAFEVATLTRDEANKYQPSFSGIGSRVWSFVHTETNGMNYSIPSDLTVLDMNSDGFQDRIYVGDTGGRMWRFDVGSTATTDWTTSGRIIFNSNKVGGETTVGRKIFYKPTVALLLGIPTLYFGTGDRSHPLNTAVIDRMFAVRDRGQLTADAIDIDNMENFTSNELQASDTDVDEAKVITDRLALATNYGWYVDLYKLVGGVNISAGEKVLAPTLVFSKQAFYTTYQPLPSDSLDVCQVGNLGVSRLYQLDYATAEATQNYFSGTGSNDSAATYATNIRAKGGDGIGLQREDRQKEIGVGIPSTIVSLIDASGKVTLMISSSNRVGTYQAPSAKMMSPLYWIQY